MKKWKRLSIAALFTMLFVSMSACSHSSDEGSESDTIPASTEDSSQSTDSTGESDTTEKNQLEPSSNEDSTAQVDTSQEKDSTTAKTKVEGKKEYLEKLDNIQKELDAMPEKKDSDKGITIAMKNYYGISYDKYDDALNEIYALLKKELSPEIMEELKTEEVNWIEQKEEKAKKARLKYEGGTFENVAWYISLYESTKDRCYELVKEYMKD